MNEDFEKGLALFADVYGQDMADGCRKGAEPGDNFAPLRVRWAMELAFGQLWTREDKLSRRDRSLTVLGMCIAQSAVEEIKFHTIMGVANGLTRSEIEEVLYSAIPYCGFPAANTANAAMLEGFKELEQQGRI